MAKTIKIAIAKWDKLSGWVLGDVILDKLNIIWGSTMPWYIRQGTMHESFRHIT